MHNVTHIDYRTVHYAGKSQPTTLSQLEQSKENGVSRLHHLSALLFLLQHLRIREDPNVEDLNCYLTEVGDLASKIVVGLFGDFETLTDELDKGEL